MHEEARHTSGLLDPRDEVRPGSKDKTQSLEVELRRHVWQLMGQNKVQ
jgi:hypothetical protein